MWGGGLHSGSAALSGRNESFGNCSDQSQHELCCCGDGTSPPPFAQRRKFVLFCVTLWYILDVKASLVIIVQVSVGLLVPQL